MEEINVKTEIIKTNPSNFMWMILNKNNEQLSALIIMMFADIQLKVEIINKLEEIEKNVALHPYGYMATSKFRYIESLVEMDENTEDRILAVKKENGKEEEKDNNDELQIHNTIDPTVQKLEEAVSYEQGLFNKFADFKKHSEFLKKEGFYEVGEGHLRWKLGGNLLLAAYFGMIQDRPGNRRCIWADIEKAFNMILENPAEKNHTLQDLNKRTKKKNSGKTHKKQVNNKIIFEVICDEKKKSISFLEESVGPLTGKEISSLLDLLYSTYTNKGYSVLVGNK
jgi:hypothetical protein